MTLHGLTPGWRQDIYPDGTPYPRFGPFPEGYQAPLPAPELPKVQLRPRG